MFNMQEALANISNRCGLDVGGEKISSADDNIAAHIEEATGGSMPLANFLQYQFFDEENNIFINEDKTSGFFFEINPKVGHDANLEKNLTLFFNDELPEDGYLQFLIVASNDISMPFKVWESGVDNKIPVLDELTSYRKAFIKKCAGDFANASNGRLARNYRTFVSYSTTGEYKNLIKFKQKLLNKLKAEKLYPNICNGDDLINITNEILKMKLRGGYNSKYDKNNSLSDQICAFGNHLKITDQSIEYREHTSSDAKLLVSKVFLPKKLPEEFSLAQMVGLLGNDYRSIPARFVISFTVANSLGSSGTSKLLTQGHRSVHAAEKSYTRNSISAKREASEWRDVFDLHKSNNEKFFKESMFVMLTATQDEIEVAEEVLKSLWNGEDWQLEQVKRRHFISSLAMLPMLQCSFGKSLDFFKMSKIAMSGEVVAKLPIQGEWKGVPKSGMLLIGRRGQLFNWNPFYRIGGGGNFNITVMAPSGSGKSFFLQDLAQSMMKQNVQIFVMDIGSSFKTLCQSTGGELIGFDSRTKISLNPFATLSNSGAKYAKALEMLEHGKLTSDEICQMLNLDAENFSKLKRGDAGGYNAEDDIELMEIRSDEETHYLTKDSFVYAKTLVSAMCGVVNNAAGQGLVEQVLRSAIIKHGEDLDVSKLAQVMSSMREVGGMPSADAGMLTTMVNSLYPYTKEGVHGRYFATGETATFKQLLTVFELDAIKDDEPLLAVVLQVILMQITSQFLLGDRSKNFMLIVDEAWKILDYAASFLETAARTFRKYGGSLVVCTQDLSSFDNSYGDKKSQAAVLESSTWKIIGQQDETGLASFAKSEEYGKITGLIKSVHKCSQNNYAEMLISTNNTKIVGRLATDPFSVAMFSTEREDFNFLEKEEKAGKPVIESLRQLASKYGDLEALKNEM